MTPPPDQTPASFGLTHGEVELVSVGPEWAERFVAERSQIASALGQGALAIEHIGSTAIPGILAKPILDIAVAMLSF